MLLTAAFVLQTVMSFLMMVPLVLAPSILPAFGLPQETAGFYAPLVFGPSLLSAVLSGKLIARVGAWKVICVACGVSGVGLLVASSGSLAALAIGAGIIGLSYGTGTPAGSSVVLDEQPRRIGLALSVRQTGVPLGIGLAGIVAPNLSNVYGWSGACLILGGTSVLFAGAISLLVTAPIRDRVKRRMSLLEPLKLVIHDKRLLVTTLIVTILSGVQNCVWSFLSLFLVTHVGLDLVTAGLMIGIFQGAGIVGRIGWGLLSDYIIAPRLLLALLGLATGCTLLNLAYLSAGSTSALIVLSVIVIGLTATGWNGVYLAEVAQAAPEGTTAAITGATIVYSFSGFIILPMLFSLVFASYGFPAAFIAIGGLSIVTVMPSLAARFRARVAPR